MTILFSRLALMQLEEVYDYISQFNPRSAARIHRSILDEIEMLASQPGLGYVEPLLEDLPGGYRTLVVGKKYKALYRVDGQEVIVLTIHDCRRDPARLKQSVEE